MANGCGENVSLLGADDYARAFDPNAYLRDFYASPVCDSAMTMVLAVLPIVVERLPVSCGRVLDIGTGPTVHVAIAFRKKADVIYLSDYLPQNRTVLNQWRQNTLSFDWSPVLRFMLAQETLSVLDVEQAECQARYKVQAILECDIFSTRVIKAFDKSPTSFDVITSFFCIEYACKNSDDYRNAVGNVISLLNVGGHLVLGGVLSELWYQFDGRRFSCYYLVEKELFATLANFGMDVRPDHMYYYNHCDVFVLIAQRRFL